MTARRRAARWRSSCSAQDAGGRPRPGRSRAAQLEVAVLDRERPRRTFRRIGGPLLDRAAQHRGPDHRRAPRGRAHAGTARHPHPGPAGRARAHGRPRGTGPARAGPAVTIAVTGATGALGAAVARLLAEAGVEQRLVVRDASRAPRLPGAEVAVASYADTEAMARALDGVRTLFLVSGPRGSRPDLVAPQRGRGRPALPASSGWSTPRSWVRRRRRPSPTHATTPPPSSPYGTPAWR